MGDQTWAKKSGESALDAYFKGIIVLNRAFTPGPPFRDSHAPVGSEGGNQDRTTLWLGCNVLRTPHLAELAINVMRLLNPEFSILGGPSHCCGSPMSEKSERQQALQRAIGHFQAERAPTLITWCPSCHTNLRKGSDSSTWGFDELHITEFIASRLDRLTLHRRLSARVMLHGHTGTADRDKDMDYCRRILEAIPGVSIVGEHKDADLGVHCVPSVLGSQIGAEVLERKFAMLLASVQQAGADMLVTIYHSCYRELEKRLNASEATIENYITLLAKALSLPVAPNVYREIAHGEATRIEQIKSEAQARGIQGGELQEALSTEFPSLREST